MPIRNQWLIPQQVILSQVSGMVTLAEFITSNEEVTLMIQEAACQEQCTLYLMVDASQVKTLPSTLEMVRHSHFVNEAALVSIWVGGLEALPLRFVVKMIARLFPKPTLLYDTVSQALLALQAHDPSLPDLLHAHQELRQANI